MADPQTSDEARGWTRLDLSSNLPPLTVESRFGGTALVIPLSIPATRPADPADPRTAKEWGLEAGIALRAALGPTGFTLDDVIQITLGAPNAASLKDALSGVRALLLPPRPVVQGVLLDLPPENPIAIGAVAVARVKAAASADYSGMTLA
jgi:hypothetical protein